MAKNTKNKMKNQNISAWKVNSKVGVFWGYQGKIIAGTTQFKNADDDGYFVNSPYSHVEYWKVVRKRCPELNEYEYEDIPRGRVLFSKEDEVFYIYMDKKLCNESYKRQVLMEFAISQYNKEKIQFKTDLHYTTDKYQIDLLFSEKV